MRFKHIITIAWLLFLTSGCSTEPELNPDKLHEYRFILCTLNMTPGRYGIPEQNFVQQVSVQKVRYLIDLVFNPDKEQTFGVNDAEVSIIGPDSTFHFKNIGNGLYEYARQDTITPFRYGAQYSLKVIFPDGTEAVSTITTPMIYFEPKKDTIRVQPDSVTSWTYPPEGGRYPLTYTGAHFSDTIFFRITEGSVLNSPAPSIFLSGHSWNTESFWVAMDTTAESLIFRTAADKPGDFVNRKVIGSYMVFHQGFIDYNNMTRDDSWPIENLEEISNINGAFGIFTAPPYDINKQYILALKK